MKKQMNRAKTLVSLLLTLAMVLSLAIGFSACSGSATNLGDYITIVVEGYDKAGKASRKVDYAALAQDTNLREKMSKAFSDKQAELLEALGDDATLMAMFLPAMDEADMGNLYVLDMIGCKFSFDKNEGLSNGEKVVLNVSYDENRKAAVEKVVGVKLKIPTQVSRTIGSDELPAATAIDVASYIEMMKFKGSEGSCEMKLGIANQQETVGGFSVKTSNEDKSIAVTKDGHTDTYKYEIVKLNGEEEFGSITTSAGTWSNPKTYYSLKNGDKITIGIKNLPDGDAGYVFTNTNKEYTVKGLKPLIKTVDEIPIDSLKADVSKQLAKDEFFKRESTTYKFFYQKNSSAEHINRIVVRVVGEGYMWKEMKVLFYDDVYEEDGILKYNDGPDVKVYQNWAAERSDFDEEFDRILDTDAYKITDIKI